MNRFRTVLMLATILTWVIGVADVQYNSEQQVAFQNDFPGERSLWHFQGDHSGVTVEPNGVNLFNTSENTSIAFREFTLPERSSRSSELIRVRGTVKTEREASVLPRDEQAAFLVWFISDKSNGYAYRTVERLTGHQRHIKAEVIVRIPTDAKSFALAMVSRSSDGHFVLTSANASLVSTSLLYDIIRPSIFALWLVLVVISSVWVTKQKDYILSISLSCLLILIIVGVSMPSSITMEVVEPAYARLALIMSFSGDASLTTLYKIGHFLFFFLIALLMFARGPKIGLSHATTVQFLVIFIVATEGLQLYLFNRTTQILDMALDFSGVILAWFLVVFLESFMASVNRK